MAADGAFGAAQAGALGSDDRLQLFADGIPTLAWMANADGYITWYNRRWHDYCGTTPEEMEGWGWQSVHDPERLPAVMERWTSSIATGDMFEMTFPLRGADGIFRPFLTRVIPHRDGAGTIVRWFGTNTDVSSQLAAEAALEAARAEAEARARETSAILGQLAEGVIVADVDGRITFVNEAAVALHGVERLDVAPEDYSDTYHLFTEDGDPYPPGDLPLARAVGGMTVIDARWRIVRPDGTDILAIGSARPVRDAAGIQTGAVLTVRDDTARDAAERALREVNATLEQRVADALAGRKVFADVVESTDAFIMVLALDYTILALNRASADEFRRIYGVRPVTGDNVLTLLEAQPEHRDQVRQHWSRALAGEEFSFVEEFGSTDHARGTYSIKFNALRGREGNRVGAFSFVNDVTSQRRDQERLAQAEEQLRQAQKIEAIGQLTGGVAHDFNNLLMVISGGLEMIDRHQDPARRARVLAAMRHATERGATLSRQLLAFSRRQPLRPVPVDLANQVGAMRELLDGSLRGDVHVRTEFADGLWPVAVDPGELELVILNLAVNARDAMPRGGTIVIRAENCADDENADPRGGTVRLAVIDKGTGMLPDVLARAFEPFFTTKDIGKGSGLGLAQAHGFARSSGGDIAIDTTPGVGTTVSLVFPRCHESPSTPTADQVFTPVAVADDRSTLGTVLVVEDDDEVAVLATDMLDQLGYATIRVSSADAALGALADDRHIDLVFSDIMMAGGMNGVELAREIGRRRPGLRVVLTSGYAGNTHDGEPLDFEVLAKPYRLEALAAALQPPRG